MFRKISLSTLIVLIVLIMTATSVFAAWYVDADGYGFVGKGDVQLIYGWNNKALQDNASDVDFRISSVTETTWTCTKVVELGNGGENEIVQERTRTTTLQGLFVTVARENSKGKDGPVTGFYLNGFEGDPTFVTDGPAVGSCPANPSGFEYDNNAETVQVGGGGLQVSINGTDWYPVP